MSDCKQPELSEQEEASLSADFASAEISPERAMMSAEDLEDDAPKKGKSKRKLKPAEPQVEPEPQMSDPAWGEFVMKQFADEELDPDGRPLVHGLRRVTRLLLGPILASKSHVVQAPSFSPLADKFTMLQPAVVEHTVRVLNCRLEQGMEAAYEVEFTDAADCYAGNVPDAEFARYLTAMAATRAESRALRKALQISCISSEEKSAVPAIEASVDGRIVPEQVNFIDVLCHRNGVDVMKFINLGKNKYETIYDVPYGVAAKMVEHLSGYQNDQKSIPEGVKGYNKNWRSK